VSEGSKEAILFGRRTKKEGKAHRFSYRAIGNEGENAGIVPQEKGPNAISSPV